ncbi:response regulator transcription factor [Sulfurospirillum arcachonense]|uniref:response regulator transcription factor n=1 Tax=Sulfurospirillum arcachonense TaxID=57666 RepID=UPI00046A751B|nr:response regulator transcription factor [Sulfurospirillum arcachonense]
MKIISFSNNKEYIKRYPNFLHIKSEDELEIEDDFIFVVEIANIKYNEEEFYAYVNDISTCKGIFCLTCKPNFTEGSHLLNLGIKGYGNLHMSQVHMQDALNTIENGNVWLYPEFVQLMIKSFSKNIHEVNHKELDLLSLREQEIASLVKEGLSNKEIAQQANITERTVKAHMSSIFTKLHVKDRVALVIKLSTNVQ